MSRISTVLDDVTYVKLSKRAKRAGMTPEEAMRVIATKGVKFFLKILVGATKSSV